MRHLVMVVPGIGGSVLADDRGVVWAAGIGDVAGLLVDPERLDLGSVEWLRPRGLIGSRSLCPGWTVVHGYDGLLDLLGRLDGALVDRAAGDDPGVRVPGATVVAFPYDFRRSIVDAAELLGAEVDRRLSDLGGARSKRVIVVAHSMGGLVARYWLGPLGGWRVCRALVTAGTPHRGAVKALRMLVDGPGVGPFRADGVRELFRGWRSVYELLPTYKAVWDAAEGFAVYPRELRVAGFNHAWAREAFEVHETIEREWREMARSGPEVTALHGWTHPTLQAASRDRSGAVRFTKAAPDWVQTSGWERVCGDGTVPAVAAVPQELSGAQQGVVASADRHGPIASTAAILKLVRRYEARGDLGAVRGGGGGRRSPVLGLDLEECYEHADGISVSVTVHGCRATDESRVMARVCDERGSWVELAADADGAFAGVLRAANPGLHDVEAIAIDLDGAADLRAEDACCTVVTP